VKTGLTSIVIYWVLQFIFKAMRFCCFSALWGLFIDFIIVWLIIQIRDFHVNPVFKLPKKHKKIKEKKWKKMVLWRPIKVSELKWPITRRLASTDLKLPQGLDLVLVSKFHQKKFSKMALSYTTFLLLSVIWPDLARIGFPGQPYAF